MKVTLLCAAMLLAIMTFGQVEEINQMDAEGKKHGIWEKKYPESDQVRYRGEFNHGIPTGTFFYYYENGAKSSEITHNGEGISEAKFFHENGVIMGEGKYVNQKKHGEWRYYDNQAILSTIEPNVNGKIDGTLQVFHLNGKLAAEINYVDGLKTGPFKEFAPNGTVIIQGTYVDNTFAGEYKQFYDDGTLYISGQYRAAVKDGLWKYFHTDGRLKVQQVYEKGKLVKEKIEDGFDREEIDIESDEENKLDEEQLMDEFLNAPPR